MIEILKGRAHSPGVERMELERASFERITLAVREKDFKLLELLTTEESYSKDLAAIMNIKTKAQECKEPDSDNPMPKGLRFLFFTRVYYSINICSEGRDQIMFRHVNEIVDLHQRIFKELLEAGKNSESILELFRRNMIELKHFYGKFCINQEKARFIWDQFQDFFKTIESTGEHLVDLYLRF